jgi:hypothetical protein
MAGAIAAALSASTGICGAQQLPSVNIQETCRIASGVMVSLLGGNTTQNDVDICLETENKARDQIVKDWSSYQASDRSGCIQPAVYLPSYVEWLTCFEMNKVVREARASRGGPPPTGAGGIVTLPIVPWARGF